MLAVLTQVPDGVLRALQIAGSVLLLYLAREAWIAARQPALTASPDGAAAWDSLRKAVAVSLRKAVAVNLLNPNPYIFWGVVGGPLLLEGWDTAARYGVGFLAAFYVALVGTLAGFAVLFSAATSRGPRVTQIMGTVSAVLLFIFGLYQLALGIAG